MSYFIFDYDKINQIIKLIDYKMVVFLTQGTAEQWRRTFFISSGLYLMSWFIFVVFVNSEIQEWAKIPEEEDLEQTSNGEQVVWLSCSTNTHCPSTSSYLNS